MELLANGRLEDKMSKATAEAVIVRVPASAADSDYGVRMLAGEFRPGVVTCVETAQEFRFIGFGLAGHIAHGAGLRIVVLGPVSSGVGFAQVGHRLVQSVVDPAD